MVGLMVGTTSTAAIILTAVAFGAMACITVATAIAGIGAPLILRLWDQRR